MSFLRNLYIVAIISLSLGFAACSGGSRGADDDGGGQSSMKDWKWYEYRSEGYTVYSNDSVSGGSINKHTEVQLPFFDVNTGPAALDLYNSKIADVDMYPEDGWVLIKADFGTDTKAPNMPYFILYNKGTATLRYVFYHTNVYQQPSYAMVNLELLSNSDDTSPMFSFFDSDKCFSENYDEDKNLTTISDISSSRGWSYADFIISYDPIISEKENLKFYLTVHIVEKSAMDLSGDITLNQVMEESNVHSSGSVSAGDLINATKKGYKVYKDAKKFFKYCNSVDPDKKWYGEILNSIGGLSSLAGGSIVPGIGIIAGIYSSGIFGNKDSQPVPLCFEGEISLSGEIKKTTPIEGIGFTVPGAKIDTDHQDEIPYYTKPLGIFSIKSKPVVDVTVTTRFLEYKSKGCVRYYLDATSIKFKDGIFPEIVFNNIDDYVIDKIEYGFNFSNATPINYGYKSTQETSPVQVHEKFPVEFILIDSFVNLDLNYSDKFSRSWMKWTVVQSPGNYYFYEKDKIQCIKQVASVVAPEVSIKVTMYSDHDAEKKNPIIHLKRVRADYNLYRDETTWKEDQWQRPYIASHKLSNLGFFEN